MHSKHLNGAAFGGPFLRMVAAASAKSPTLARFASVGFEFIEQSLKYVTT